MQAFLASVEKYCTPGRLKLSVERFKGMGYGVKSTESLKSGEVILKIPFKLWYPLSVARAWEEMKDQAVTANLLDYLRQETSAGNTQVSQQIGGIMLALLLLKETESKQSLHLNAICKQVDVPVFWNAEQISELQASPVIPQIYMRRSHIADVFENVIKRSDFFVSPSNFAWAVFSARKNIPFAIVPFLDLFNHTATITNSGYCEFVYDEQFKSFLLYPTRDTPKDTQLCISYGTLSNAQLLDRYGFVVEKNPNDTISLRDLNFDMSINKSGEIVYQENGNKPSNIKTYLQEILGLYRTSINQDEALLKELKAQDLIATAKSNALVLRLGEKQMITAAITN